MLQEIEEFTAYCDDYITFGIGGDDEMEKKTITFDRQQLYTEIWKIGLSKTAKQYKVPYQKLKEACEKANIPLPTQSYWAGLYVGKTTEKESLPKSEETEVKVIYPTRISSEDKLQVQKPNKQVKDAKDTAQKEPEELEPPETLNGQIVYKRKTLYKEVWSQPVTKIAKKYGVSDVMIHKICNSMAIPVPPRGYWARIASGQKIKKPSLPSFMGEAIRYGRIWEEVSKENKKQKEAPAGAPLNFLEAEVRTDVMNMASEMQVVDDGHKLHRVLLQHRVSYKRWKQNHPRDEMANWHNDYYRSAKEGEPALWESVSEQTLPRTYRILDCIYRGIEGLGGSVNEDFSVIIQGEHIKFDVAEQKVKTPHVMTREELKKIEEYEKEKSRYSYAYEPKFRKYDYLPNGKLSFGTREHGFIRDSSTNIIETRVGEILLMLYKESESVRIAREAEEAKKRAEEERKRQEELRREAYDDEVDKLYALLNETSDYDAACQIRAYVAAVEAKPELAVSKAEWLTWAKAKADWLDPTVDKEDSVFGKLKHGKKTEEKMPSRYGPSLW